MAITLGGGGSSSQINEVVTLNNTADTVTLADGRVYLKGGVFETNLSTYPLALSGLQRVLNFTVLQDTTAQGVTWDGTNYWVVGATNDRVYKYDAAGAYTSTFFSISSQSTSPADIEWDGTYLWVLDNANNKLFSYNTAGTYISQFSVNAQVAGGWKGFTWDGTFFWVANSNGNVYKYNSSGVYQSVTFSIASETTSIQGIAWDGTYFWVADYYQTLYKYNSSGVYQNETIATAGYLVGVGAKDNFPMVVIQTPRSVDVYAIVNGVVSVADLGAQNYVRVV